MWKFLPRDYIDFKKLFTRNIFEWEINIFRVKVYIKVHNSIIKDKLLKSILKMAFLKRVLMISFTSTISIRSLAIEKLHSRLKTLSTELISLLEFIQLLEQNNRTARVAPIRIGRIGGLEFIGHIGDVKLAGAADERVAKSSRQRRIVSVRSLIRLAQIGLERRDEALLGRHVTLLMLELL